MNTTVNAKELNRIIIGEHGDPFTVLGIHKIEDDKKNGSTYAIRAYIPNIKEISVIDLSDNEKYKMDMIDEKGFFEVLVKNKKDVFPYKFEITDSLNNTFMSYDPYSFWPVLTDEDLKLFNMGDNHKIYEYLGAHTMSLNSVKGTLFCVWAPCAKRVSVVGNFNQWDGRHHQMRCLYSSGVWEIFIPEIDQGDVYKFEIKTPSGEIYCKSDPYAFYSELRPNTASIVYDIESYEWNDDTWIKGRESSNSFEKPISIYEVHLGSWKRASDEDDDGYLTYRELAEQLVEYVLQMGYTHIELMPVAEHPFDGSWGYQITGYYSITSRFGSPEEFMYFVDYCHQNDIGVILDWVPAHFPKDGHGLARFDGTALYEHEDPRQGEHPDWGTHIFNFGRPEVRNFLVSNAVFLFEKYHIDGLRVDAVASMLYLDYGKKHGEWIPNKWGGKENVDAIGFMRQLNTTVYKYFPGVMMIAEESTSWALVSKPPYVGGLGFTYKWNMGWMNDFIRYASMDPVFRKFNHNLLTFSFMYSFSENFVLVLSHDEVVHGKCSMINKMPGDYWQKFAGLRACYAYLYGHPGKKLLFMGSEFGQFKEWDFKSSLDWSLLDTDMHKMLQRFVRDLNYIYKAHKALYEIDFAADGFEWIDCNDSDRSIISFIRKGKSKNDMLLFVCNFTPVVYETYKIGVPYGLEYEQIINSDSEIYGGSGIGNFYRITPENSEIHGRPFSLNLTIPPFGVMILKPIFEDNESLESEKQIAE